MPGTERVKFNRISVYARKTKIVFLNQEENLENTVAEIKTFQMCTIILPGTVY